MVGLMGPVAAAGDNVAMESFFSLLQKNVLNRRRWNSRERLRIAIVTWIEGSTAAAAAAAGGAIPPWADLTPIEFEAIMTTPPSQAA